MAWSAVVYCLYSSLMCRWTRLMKTVRQVGCQGLLHAFEVLFEQMVLVKC
jgi:hypothetical protein